jgi:membrane-associated PAP2 superfamily phosphatase
MPRDEETTETRPVETPGGGHAESGGATAYLRFGAMIATPMVFMYGLMCELAVEIIEAQRREVAEMECSSMTSTRTGRRYVR